MPPVRIRAGSRPQARASARAGDPQRLGAGIEARRRGGVPPSNVELGACPAGRRAAAPRARREIAAGSWPGASRTDRSQGRPAGRSCAPRRRGCGARRARRRRRCAPRTRRPRGRRRAVRRPAASSPAPSRQRLPAASSSGGRRLDAGAQRLRQAAVGAGQDGGERCGGARGRRSARRRRRRPNGRSARRCGPRDAANTMPRVAVVIAGVSGSSIPESNTIAQSAPRSSASTHSLTSSVPDSSAPSISTRTCTGSSPASAIAHATCSSGRKLPLSSAAPRAYRRPSRMSGSNGGVVQSRLVARVLHVVVAVDQHGRRVLARGAQLADHQRRAAGRVDQLARAAGREHAPQRPLGGLAQRLVVALAGGDRRDAQPVGRLVDERVELVAHLITASVSPLVTAAPSEIGSSARPCRPCGR